jgi:hypothetical protein
MQWGVQGQHLQSAAKMHPAVLVLAKRSAFLELGAEEMKALLIAALAEQTFGVKPDAQQKLPGTGDAPDGEVGEENAPAASA